MTCGCEYDSCNNLRRRCWSCSTQASGAEKMAEAAARIERAIGPEAERDRRVGAAVRACAPDSFDLATTLSEAARELDRDDVQFPIAAGALRAIAAALREEEGR